MKLITWNVQWFCGLDGVVNVERVLHEARAMADFDVLCLQEVAINYPALEGNAGFDQVARLRELLPGYQVFFGAAVQELGRQGQWQQFGNLVATRLPVAQVQHHALPYPAEAGVRSMPRMCTCVTVMTREAGAVRVMSTHLEFYSTVQRLAQAQALLDLHVQGGQQQRHAPERDETGSPFQSKPHTGQTLLCGDFNFESDSGEYRLLQTTSLDNPDPLTDAWRALHGSAPHDPSFRLLDRRYGPVPICCDFVFASRSLVPHLQSLQVNLKTQASDHQPLLLTLA